MYKINRMSSNLSNKHHITITSTRKNTFSRGKLIKNLNNFNTLLINHSLDRINAMKRLTKENIDTFNYQKLKNKSNLIDNQQRQIYHNSILPKIPEYKSMNKQNNQINKNNQNKNNQNTPISLEEAQNMLVNRKVQSQEDMAKVFNAIMNGDAIQPKNKQENTTQNKQQEKTNQIIQVTQQQKAKIKLDTIQQLKQKIISDDHIDYNQIYQICSNLYIKFSKNSMIKSILMRSIDRFNRSQFYKIPDDKIKQLIEIIIINMKKIYK